MTRDISNPSNPSKPSTPPPETIMVPASADQVKCDGGGGALGHPVVWYSFAGKNRVECAYCDRLFLKESA